MDREEPEGPKPIVDLVNGDRIEATIVVIPEGAASAGGTPGTELVNRETREGSNMNPSETVVVIDSDRTACGVVDGESIEKKNGMGLRKDFEKRNVKSNKENPVLINVRQKGGKGFNEEWNGERVCRICHLASDQASGAKTGTSTSELIQLGCDCKDELGIAHTHCAEAWFKLKGNRFFSLSLSSGLMPFALRRLNCYEHEKKLSLPLNLSHTINLKPSLLHLLGCEIPSSLPVRVSNSVVRCSLDEL